MYCISPKIFWLVSTLFGLKTTDNLYEFKYLYPNQTFSKFPQQNYLPYLPSLPSKFVKTPSTAVLYITIHVGVSFLEGGLLVGRE
jgi:hypothetical protein